MTKPAHITKENEIAFIALSNAPMNALSQGVRAGLRKGVEDSYSTPLPRLKLRIRIPSPAPINPTNFLLSIKLFKTFLSYI